MYIIYCTRNINNNIIPTRKMKYYIQILFVMRPSFSLFATTTFQRILYIYTFNVYYYLKILNDFCIVFTSNTRLTHIIYIAHLIPRTGCLGRSLATRSLCIII